MVIGSRTLERTGAVTEIVELLERAEIECVRLASIHHEPEVPDVDLASGDLRAQNAGQGDFVLAIGGGSAIDLGKAAAAMATNLQSDTVKDYLEGVGRSLTLVEPPLPILAMPTTGGTGTEATKNAVLTSYDPPYKKSLRDDRLIPRVVIVDPELSVSVPADITAWTGMDAITQLIESYICRHVRPIPRALALEGLCCALPALETAVHVGKSRPAREAMAHAALLSGLALANSGLGLAHGVAAALGACVRVPHGLACAMMLPVALRVNRRARLADMACLASFFIDRPPADDEQAADAFIEHIENLATKVGVPRKLSELGVTAGHLPALVSGSRGNSMNGNPVSLTDDELTGILEQML